MGEVGERDGRKENIGRGWRGSGRYELQEWKRNKKKVEICQSVTRSTLYCVWRNIYVCSAISNPLPLFNILWKDYVTLFATLFSLFLEWNIKPTPLYQHLFVPAALSRRAKPRSVKWSVCGPCPPSWRIWRIRTPSSVRCVSLHGLRLLLGFLSWYW